MLPSFDSSRARLLRAARHNLLGAPRRTIEELRLQVAREAYGVVVEFGPGHAWPVVDGYGPQVDLLLGIDNHPKPEALWRARLRGGRTTLIGACAEQTPLVPSSVDCVICVFALCAMDSPPDAIAEAERLMPPGGRFAFLEHVPDPGWRGHVQRREVEHGKRPAHILRDPRGDLERAFPGVTYETFQTWDPHHGDIHAIIGVARKPLAA